MFIFGGLLLLHTILMGSALAFVVINGNCKRGYLFAFAGLWFTFYVRVLTSGAWVSWLAMDDIIQTKLYGVETSAEVVACELSPYPNSCYKCSIVYDGYHVFVFLDRKYEISSKIPIKYLANAPLTSVIPNDRDLSSLNAILNLVDLRGQNLQRDKISASNVYVPLEVDSFIAISTFLIALFVSRSQKKEREHWLNELKNNPEEYPANMLSGRGVPVIEEFKGHNAKMPKNYGYGEKRYIWPWEYLDRIDPFMPIKQLEFSEIYDRFNLDEQIGRKRIYCKGFAEISNIISWDIQRINKEQVLKATFVQTNSAFRQGIRLAIDAGEGNIEVKGKHPTKGVWLWVDTAPQEIICKCTSPEGLISIYNLWDKGDGGRSLGYTSGMLIEEEDNKITYRCNDCGYDTNFDKLIFTIEKM